MNMYADRTVSTVHKRRRLELLMEIILEGLVIENGKGVCMG